MLHFHTHIFIVQRYGIIQYRAQYSIDNILQNAKSKNSIHWINLIIPGYKINNINSDNSLL